MADVYLDACCFIYLVEGASPWRAAVGARLAKLEPGGGLVTSRLSRLECRTKPLRAADSPLLDSYEALFATAKILEVSSAVIERATSLRAICGFRAPNAIHLATAVEVGAALFLTGDAALARCKDLVVEVLDAAATQ